MKLKCTCKNEYQDKEHGNGVRVHNPMKKEKDRPQYYRCTVCLNEKTAPIHNRGYVNE